MWATCKDTKASVRALFDSLFLTELLFSHPIGVMENVVSADTPNLETFEGSQFDPHYTEFGALVAGCRVLLRG